jgi:hypothetical protein
MSTTPGFCPETAPELLTEAIAGASEDHTAVALTSPVDPSENVPRRVNWCGTLVPIEKFMGESVTEVSKGGTMVTFTDPVTPDDIAEIVAVP